MTLHKLSVFALELNKLFSRLVRRNVSMLQYRALFLLFGRVVSLSNLAIFTFYSSVLTVVFLHWS